jgi:hypothetical protein
MLPVLAVPNMNDAAIADNHPAQLSVRVALSYCELSFAATFATQAQVDFALFGTYRQNTTQNAALYI